MGQASGKSIKQQLSNTDSLDSQSEDSVAVLEELDLMHTPDDILEEVLKWVPGKDIVRSCVLVCHQWREVINTQTFWKKKCIIDHYYTEEVLLILRIEDFKWLYFNNPYNRNLVLNPDASKGLNHWNILFNGGSRWQVEDQIGCDPVCDYTQDPSHKGIKCWATSYYSCGKEQIIELHKRGVSAYVLDSVRPDIIISEWYAARFDCGIQYKVTVQLLRSKSDTNPVTEWTFEDTKTAGRSWFKASHTFTHYEPGVRFVRFYHEGQDTQFWAGWYGAKMTLSSVVIDLFHTAGPPAHAAQQSDTL